MIFHRPGSRVARTRLGCWVICQFSTLGRAGHILLELSGLIIYPNCYLGHKHRITQYKYLDTTFMFRDFTFAHLLQHLNIQFCVVACHLDNADILP